MFKHGKMWICSIWITRINQEYLSLKEVYAIAKIVTSSARVYGLETMIGYTCTDGDIGESNLSSFCIKNKPKSKSLGWFIKSVIYSTQPICEVFVDTVIDEIYAWTQDRDIECYVRYERGRKSQIEKFQSEGKWWWYVDKEEIKNRKLEEEFKKNVFEKFSFLVDEFGFEIKKEFRHLIYFSNSIIVCAIGCDFRYTKKIIFKIFLAAKPGFAVSIDYLLSEFNQKNLIPRVLRVFDMSEIIEYLINTSIFLKNNLDYLLDDNCNEFMRIVKKHLLEIGVDFMQD